MLKNGPFWKMAAILKFTWLTGFFTRMTQEVQSVIFWCFFPDLKDFFAYLLYYMAVYPFTNHVTLGAGGVTVSAWMCCMLLICEDKKTHAQSHALYIYQDSKGQITRRNCDSWPPDVTPTLPLLRIRPRLNIFIFMSVWCFFCFFW